MIKVRDLSKTIDDKSILNRISFTIEKGETAALIGLNGAGKTTLMTCLIGDRVYEEGSILVDHKNPKEYLSSGKLAVLGQENELPELFKVNELISFYQSIYDDPLTISDIDSLLQFTDSQKNTLTKKLSGGQKRWLSFILTLIGKPDIVYLDEPTVAMDTVTRVKFWDTIKQLKKQGVTILYSSHYIEEVEQTADRILLLHKGELIQNTTPYQLRMEGKCKEFTIPFMDISYLEHLPIENIQVNRDSISFTTKEPALVFNALQDMNYSIDDIEMRNQTLLTRLFHYTKES